MQRCDALGAISDEPGRLTRTFHSPAMARANALVGGWMRDAGLDVREDAAFNLIGRWTSNARRRTDTDTDTATATDAGRATDARHRPRARRHMGTRTLLIGSHLDTVRDAGKYDGPLGVLVALAAVQHLREAGRVLPFDVEIVGFSDEEGVRYQTTYLGSRAMAGTLTRRDLARIEEKGIERARRRRGELFAYLEAHIEQGPVLDQRNMPLAVVGAIAGQSRVRVELHGRAGHAGTTPMDLRRDALCGAAELVLAVERCGVTATVGQIAVEPGASNVIPGRVVLSLDVRHAQDRRREAAVRRLHAAARAIARRRGLRLIWTTMQETAAVRCDPELTTLLAASVARQQGARGPDAPRSAAARADALARGRGRINRHRSQLRSADQERGVGSTRALAGSARAASTVLRLASGAGHDAAALAAVCPVAMLFVRCKDGVSHHPSESVRRADVAHAIAAIADTIAALGAQHA